MTALSTRAAVRLRTVVALIFGIATTIMTAPLFDVAAGVLLGWAVFALITVAWVLIAIWGMDADATRHHARQEAPGRRVARLISIIGSVLSLTAVLIVLLQSGHATGGHQYVLAGIAVLSVGASWMLIHTEYVLRYAQMYYTEPVGGISFNQEEDPEYTDFIYFSVGLGMTFQVADTNVSRNDVRRVVIAQTTLAYLFGTVILAAIINLVSGLG